MANGLAEDEMRVLVTWDFLRTDPHRQNGWIPCVVSIRSIFIASLPCEWVFWSDLTKHPRSNGKKMDLFGVFFSELWPIAFNIRWSTAWFWWCCNSQGDGILPSRWWGCCLWGARTKQQLCCHLQKNISRWGRFFKCFYFHPKNWGRWTHFHEFFLNGWFN